jgi:putative heme iron utilization protein
VPQRPELIAEFEHEQDHGIRCWLLELIGSARDDRALPLLTEHLNNSDQALRSWAITGLQLLGHPPGPAAALPSAS